MENWGLVTYREVALMIGGCVIEFAVLFVFFVFFVCFFALF